MSSKDQIDLLLEKGDLLSKILEITDMENYLAERKLKLRERLEEIENGNEIKQDDWNMIYYFLETSRDYFNQEDIKWESS